MTLEVLQINNAFKLNHSTHTQLKQMICLGLTGEISCDSHRNKESSEHTRHLSSTHVTKVRCLQKHLSHSSRKLKILRKPSKLCRSLNFVTPKTSIGKVVPMSSSSLNGPNQDQWSKRPSLKPSLKSHHSHYSKTSHKQSLQHSPLNNYANVGNKKDDFICSHEISYPCTHKRRSVAKCLPQEYLLYW